MLLTVAWLLFAARVAWAAGEELYHLPGFHEPFSAISHLVGFVIFTFLGGALLLRGYRYCHEKEHRKTGRMFVLGLYVFTCLFQLAMSTVFHMVVRGNAAHRVVERLDHSAIFIFIAGTITPIQGLLFRGPFRWGPLTFLWITTVAALTLKLIIFDALPEWLGLSFYLALGGFGGISVIALARRHDWRYVRPLVVGGVFYTLGAIMDLRAELVLIPGIVHAHEVFHLAVLAGAFSHWLFIWDIAAEHVEQDVD